MSEQPQDYPPAQDWMRRAAEDIDVKLGLPRSDLAIEFCAKIIARAYLNHLEVEAVTKANAARLRSAGKRAR